MKEQNGRTRTSTDSTEHLGCLEGDDDTSNVIFPDFLSRYIGVGRQLAWPLSLLPHPSFHKKKGDG